MRYLIIFLFSILAFKSAQFFFTLWIIPLTTSTSRNVMLTKMLRMMQAIKNQATSCYLSLRHTHSVKASSGYVARNTVDSLKISSLVKRSQSYGW